jgi:DNA-binding NarL/FixJ family response regulator
VTIRLVIADDHPIVLSGLAGLLAGPEFKIVGKCSDGLQVVDIVAHEEPDILLLDIRMPGKSGLEILKEIGRRSLKTRVVLLTGSLTEDEAIEAMRNGVRGILLKEMVPRLLVECLRKVSAGEQWLEKASVGRAIDKLLKREEGLKEVTAVLTQREMQLLHLAVTDASSKEIAERLFISEGTVKVHLHSIYSKLSVSGRAELRRVAKEKGLI